MARPTAPATAPAPASPGAVAPRSSRRPGTWLLVGFVAWTAYVWSTRIVNALGDSAATAGSKAFSVGLSCTFLAFAVAGVVVAVRGWSRPLRSIEVLVLRLFAGWTVLVWVVRVPMIALDDRSVGFKAVHAALGLISVVLAALVWRSSVVGEPADPSAPSRPATASS